MNRRFALCSGLNYPGTSAELRGCVNDANDAAEALARKGAQVEVLLEPTKARLQLGLINLVERATYGDRIYWWHSGHGTRIPDTDHDEADHWDEAIVPADYANGELLTDDEIHAIFGAARYGVRRFIFADTCHSGSVLRFAPPFASHGQAHIMVPKFLPLTQVKGTARFERALELEDKGAVKASKPRKGTVLLSGTDDATYSYDAVFHGRGNGAFTYHALRALPKAKNVRDLHRLIRADVHPQSPWPQNPQLTALSHQRYWEVP